MSATIIALIAIYLGLFAAIIASLLNDKEDAETTELTSYCVWIFTLRH